MMDEAEGRPSFIVRSMRIYGINERDSEIENPIMEVKKQNCQLVLWDFDTLILPISIVFGVILGLTIPGNSDLSHSYRVISSLLGWTYFFCWTLSFYPQIYLNWERKSSIGLASDKILYDLLGYSCLSIYSVALYWLPSTRQTYENRNGGNSPKVEINDVCFALHALVMTFLQITQMAYYDGKKQLPTRVALVGFTFAVLLVISYAVTVSIKQDESTIFNWLDWLYFLSYVKMGVTLVKYVPQVILNYKRKSTLGWNITGCIMDITGAILSQLQLLLDCNDTHDWDGVTGDIVKLGLGSVSMVFDVIFIVQHYCLYPSAEYQDLPQDDLNASILNDKLFAQKMVLESTANPEMPLETSI